MEIKNKPEDQKKIVDKMFAIFSKQMTSQMTSFDQINSFNRLISSLKVDVDKGLDLVKKK